MVQGLQLARLVFGHFIDKLGIGTVSIPHGGVGGGRLSINGVDSNVPNDSSHTNDN